MTENDTPKLEFYQLIRDVLFTSAWFPTTTLTVHPGMRVSEVLVVTSTCSTVTSRTLSTPSWTIILDQVRLSGWTRRIWTALGGSESLTQSTTSPAPPPQTQGGPSASLTPQPKQLSTAYPGSDCLSVVVTKSQTTPESILHPVNDNRQLHPKLR